MKHANPKITVLMPVYNGERYLREAIESILSQTCKDFEFLIIDDGSIDQSYHIINSYHDSRIKLFRNEVNLGLIPTLNRGFDLASGEFIARMDCDDLSIPDRLAKQIAIMEDNPEIGVCGGWIEYFMGRQLILQLPVTDAEIKRAMPLRNPMAHPTVMIRSAVLKNYAIYYDPEYRHAEDYELWTRLAKITCFYNIPEVLLKYRIHPCQIGFYHSGEQKTIIAKIQAKFKMEQPSSA